VVNVVFLCDRLALYFFFVLFSFRVCFVNHRLGLAI
jgi:hypothetical protein